MVGGVGIKVRAPITSLTAIPDELHWFEAIRREPAIEILLKFEDRLIYLLGLTFQGSVIAILTIKNSLIQSQCGLSDVSVDQAKLVVDCENQFLTAFERELILGQIDRKAFLVVGGGKRYARGQEGGGDNSYQSSESH